MSAIIRFLVQRDLLVNLISVFIVILGLFSLFSINREAFPNVTLDRVQINVVYPGATPEEIERLVIIPIEHDEMETDLVYVAIQINNKWFLTAELGI